MTQPPPPTANEVAWSTHLAEKMSGVAEFRCIDGSRVDILTETLAIEVEWVKKWKESVGQALLYQALTGRQGCVLLLLRNKPTELLYVLRCAVACAAAGIKLLFCDTMSPDESD